MKLDHPLFTITISPAYHPDKEVFLGSHCTVTSVSDTNDGDAEIARSAFHIGVLGDNATESLNELLVQLAPAILKYHFNVKRESKGGAHPLCPQQYLPHHLN